MKISVLRVTGSTLTVIGFLIGGSGVASADPLIDNSGDKSVNVIKIENKCNATTNNNNWIDTVINNPQDAQSGNVTADNNDDVGSVSSGNASNTSNNSSNVTVNNGSSNACASQNSAGGHGGGGTSGTTETISENEVVKVSRETTLTTVTPEIPAAPTTPVTPVTQVTIPNGGVGAGSGGQSYLASLVAVTVASGAWFVARARKQLRSALLNVTM